MAELTDTVRGSALVGTTLKVVAVLAALGTGAAFWLSTSRLDTGTLARLAATVDDPVATGSLGPGAAATRLDPCALPRR